MEINNYTNVTSVYSTSAITSVEEEEEVVENTAVEELEDAQTLTAEEEMALFKEEFYKELEEVYSDLPSNILSLAVKISDEAFEKLKDDPEYKEKLLTGLANDLEEASKLGKDAHMFVSVDETEFSADFIGINSTDDQVLITAKNSLAAQQAVGSFYYDDSNVNNASSNSANDLLNSWANMTQDEKANELLQMIREQRNFMQIQQDREALQKNSSASSFFSGSNSDFYL
ncbi:MAG: hypothetical protein R3Y53_04380 [Bacillota bacterium]